MWSHIPFFHKIGVLVEIPDFGTESDSDSGDLDEGTQRAISNKAGMMPS